MGGRECYQIAAVYMSHVTDNVYKRLKKLGITDGLIEEVRIPAEWGSKTQFQLPYKFKSVVRLEFIVNSEARMRRAIEALKPPINRADGMLSEYEEGVLSVDAQKMKLIKF